MKKIHKIRCPKIITSILAAIMLAFNPVVSLVSSTAFAAPAVVPVGAELIAELLVALGLMAGNATAGYVWKANDNPYVSSVFEEQVSGITSGVPISGETLGQLSGTVIPEDTYTTDGTDFFVAGKPVTSDDVFLNADSLVGFSYGLPTNFAGAFLTDGVIPNPDGSDYWYMLWQFPSSAVGQDFYLFPYLFSNNNEYISNYGINIVSSVNPTSYKIFYAPTGEVADYNIALSLYKYLQIPAFNSSAKTATWRTHFDKSGSHYESSGSTVALALDDKIYEYVRVSGSGDLVVSDITRGVIYYTRGVPVFNIDGSSEKLQGALVQVKPSKDDDDNNGSTPPAPSSPYEWQIWKTLDDLTDFIISGQSTNGGTTLGDFVTNNYNYVDVDINVPDNVNVGLSGGLDINGKGDIDITIHEDVSLPSGGDGSGFYNPDAVDAIAALTTNNPVVQVVKGLFEAIDPALAGIFSVGVSLLVVLGLWKLIRG